MYWPLRALLLLLVGFLIFGGVPRVLAEESATAAEESPEQKALREANEAAAKARADADAAAQAQIDSTNAQIQKLKDEIAALQTNLNLTTAQKQTLQTTIKALDLQIQKLQKNVTLTSSQISVKDTEIGNLSGKIRTTEEKISDAKVAVASTLRQLERMDQEYLVTTLLGGGTLSSFFDQAVTVGSLRGELQNKMQDLGSLRTNLETSKTSAETKRKELASLKTNLNQQKQGVTATKNEQTNLLSVTKNKESEYQKLIAQKQAEEARFEEILYELSSQLGIADSSHIPTPNRGVLQWPLDSISITQQFGKTFDSVRLYASGTHDGVDFSTKSSVYPTGVGTPVKAALFGTVAEINQGAVANCQYGKWVLVKHNNGLATLYAHLSSINVQKGQSISTGEIVGLSGSTGYATGPHLHFTVYLSESVTFKQYTCKNGKAVNIPIAAPNAYLNPLSYLSAR